jgi:predicted RNase H-like nuclease (RuvC/YqgF family)
MMNADNQVFAHLVLELEQKSSAIKMLGLEVQQLRKTNLDLNDLNARLNEELDSANVRTSNIIDAFDLDALDFQELKRRYRILATLLRKTMAQNKELSEIKKEYDYISKEVWWANLEA